jgi:cullin-associated NEDD8-dissociated protein 1
MVTSNPSGSYIRAVGAAFRTGRYEGQTFSGRYGDLGASVAAIFLHPEARKPDSASNGLLREPLIKVVHLMRSLGYADKLGQGIMMKNLMEKIGQWPYHAHSVFNFYSPDFSPDGFPEGKVAPEFQIFTPPMAVNFINGMTSLITHGLSDCNRGFGAWSETCSYGKLHVGEFECLDPTVDQLDLLLTGGRLSSKEIIKAAYKEADGADRYHVAKQALILTPEFNTLGAPLAQGPRSAAPSHPPKMPRSYKAMVMLFLNGGADTFNMLVPLNCPLYDEYTQVRGRVALQPDQLHAIETEGQRCAEFGIHGDLPFLKELYDKKEAAFAANIGSLAEGLDAAQWNSGTGNRCTGLFSHSDMQRAAQTLTCQSATAYLRGAGGRAADALASSGQRYQTMSFSTAGMQTWSQGITTVVEVISGDGLIELNQRQQLQTIIDNITSIKHGNIYAETYSKQLAQGLKFNEGRAKQFKKAKLKTSFPTPNDLSRQFREVAKVMSTHKERGVEREFFFVSMGGFDMHKNVIWDLPRSYRQLNDALNHFVTELKAQDLFNNMVLLTHSDFGRTLTPNSGSGTDHAWAGNYFILGGGLKGGRIYNDFTSSYLPGSEEDAGGPRGILIPRYPWENIMLPVAEWMGLEEPQFSKVFPNIDNFNRTKLILSQSDLFHSA